MKEDISNNDLRSYFNAELNNLPLAEVFATWVVSNFQKVHISFYDDPPKSKTENPEMAWVSSKLERLRRNIEAAEIQLNRLKLELEDINDQKDISDQNTAIKQLSRNTISFHSNYSDAIGNSGLDLKQLWKNKAKNRVESVSFYLVFGEGKVMKVNKCVYPDRSIEHNITHISICKSSVSSRVKFLRSHNLNGKLGLGTINIASIDQKQLIISSSRQIWIS